MPRRDRSADPVTQEAEGRLETPVGAEPVSTPEDASTELPLEETNTGDHGDTLHVTDDQSEQPVPLTEDGGLTGEKKHYFGTFYPKELTEEELKVEKGKDAKVLAGAHLHDLEAYQRKRDRCRLDHAVGQLSDEQLEAEIAKRRV